MSEGCTLLLPPLAIRLCVCAGENATWKAASHVGYYAKSSTTSPSVGSSLHARDAASQVQGCQTTLVPTTCKFSASASLPNIVIGASVYRALWPEEIRMFALMMLRMRMLDKQDFTEQECVNHLRFRRQDLPRLQRALRIPATVTLQNSVSVSGEEALCILLYRLAYPVRFATMAAFFQRSPSTGTRPPFHRTATSCAGLPAVLAPSIPGTRECSKAEEDQVGSGWG